METSHFIINNYFNSTSPESHEQKISDDKNNTFNFTVDDLLDFSNEDGAATVADVAVFDNATTDSSNSAAENYFSGHVNCFADSQFSGELCVPYDDMAELEWLSNFVEDSFSIDQTMQKNHLTILSGLSKPVTPESSSSSTRLELSNPGFLSDTPLPGKARSKRSRAAPCDWSTRVLHVSPKSSPPVTIKRENPDPGMGSGSGSDSRTGTVRKCLHCAAEKTPQWRTGPMGPKTLCNACGVRFKSGRLVPEYRPAASPTFVSTKHSNSHRKVLELRRQKEVQKSGFHHHRSFIGQSSIFGVSNGGDEYLIHHGGGDYRHMM